MSDWMAEYKAKLKEAESKLHECEELLQSNGIEGPVSQPDIPHKEKIWLPPGYIRTASHFRNAYQLPPSISELSTRNNIAYALQFSDLLNYIHNRFYLGELSLGNVFYRTATAHIMSIIESILYGLVGTIHNHCVNDGKACKKASLCDYYMKRPNKYNFKQLLDVIRNKNIFQFTEEEENMLMALKGVRDRVHMWDAGNSDFHDEKFNVNNYNSAVTLLIKVRDEAIPAFRSRQGQQVFCAQTVPAAELESS